MGSVGRPSALEALPQSRSARAALANQMRNDFTILSMRREGPIPPSPSSVAVSGPTPGRSAPQVNLVTAGVESFNTLHGESHLSLPFSGQASR